MADPANISSILAALAAQRAGGAPVAGTFQAGPNAQATAIPPGYPGALPTAVAQANLGSFQLPQPSNTGSLDLSGIKPANSGTVSLAEAIAKAKGIAAQKGVAYDGRSGRSYPRSRSRSRSPPARRENFRDNYNPYRDERRDDRRGGGGGGGRDYRDRSFSPGPRDRRGGGNSYSPPPTRGHGGRGDRSPRGGAADDNAETIQIDSSLVGLIIGRQGENLRRVESESGARVQFVTGPEASGPSRSCRITGSRQARDEAKSEIQRIVEDNGRSGVGATGATAAATAAAPVDRRGGSHQPALREGEDSMQIMVPDRTVGLIIGRGGETIRDLQERSKCHVNIVGESKSVNGQRPVNLIGTPQAAAHAKELIMEIVDSDTKNAASQGAAVREPTRAGAYGGVGGGANGGERVNDTIRVPSEAVGMIIGKGGETIKELQNVTGCKINVSPQNGPHETERDIGLVGPRESIESAKRAIMEKVDVVKQGSRSGPSDSYRDRPMSDQRPTGPEPVANPQGPSGSSSSASVAPAMEQDPYAAYGGYNNYVAMWYAAMAQQQQLQQQGHGGQPKPPGTA